MTALLLLVTLLQPMDPATVVREAYLASRHEGTTLAAR